MVTIAPTAPTKPTIEQGKAICMVLGIDPAKVSRDGFTLEPFGRDWLVRWEGAAVLDAAAAAILFSGSEP